MSIITRATTDGLHAGGFKPHGRMQLEQSGRLNILEATGPFNLEFVIAADRAQEELYASLMTMGRWGTVLIFRESAMASLDALAKIAATLLNRKSQGYAPVAAALVFGIDVEGASLMKAHYLHAYQEAGIECRIFGNEEQAKRWLVGVIGPQHQENTLVHF